MNRNEIAERIKNLLKSNEFMSLRNLVDSIHEDTSLINDLALDSIQILELIVGIENEFGVACEYDELNLDMFDKFSHLVDFIEKKLN